MKMKYQETTSRTIFQHQLTVSHIFEKNIRFPGQTSRLHDGSFIHFSTSVQNQLPVLPAYRVRMSSCLAVKIPGDSHSRKSLFFLSEEISEIAQKECTILR